MNLSISDKFKKVLNAAEKAFKKLHSKKGYSPNDLLKEKEYINLINATYDTFNFTLEDNVVEGELLRKLQEDTFIFSGLKTHAQLFEASRLLLTEDGKIKSYNAFSNDFEKLNQDYNQLYLEAEYQFATGSAIMADKWQSIVGGDRYLLEYRTASDNRVRPEHQTLEGIKLPKEDEFWNKYYPPNGWRCRCTVAEILKSKNEASDSAAAIEDGEKATTKLDKNGNNSLEIFRFNPGKQSVIFPPNHPYNKVSGASKAIDILKSDLESKKYIPSNLDNYERKLGVTVKKDFFEYLQKDTEFLHKSPVGNPGAYYNPKSNYVCVPFDSRRKNSKWYSEAIIYHEFGHAADWHNGFRSNGKITSLMKKFEKQFKNDNDFEKLNIEVDKKYWEARDNDKHDEYEKYAAIADTLMSLNTNWGFGHTKSYFANKGFPEAEFIAHAFENRFAGNDIFEKLFPDLYEEMKKMIDDLKPKK